MTLKHDSALSKEEWQSRQSELMQSNKLSSAEWRTCCCCLAESGQAWCSARCSSGGLARSWHLSLACPDTLWQSASLCRESGLQTVKFAEACAEAIPDAEEAAGKGALC